MSSQVQRVVGGVLLLLLGLLSLPVAAFLLDGRRTENWIVPAQLAAMAAAGAALAIRLPALARDGADTGRRALTGAWWGLLAACVGVAVAWLLVSGVRGA